MAVSPTAVEPMLKANPDVSKLNTFSGLIVTVNKHLGPKGTPGSSVVPTQKMSRDDLLALQARLPLQHGAGWYKFHVSDEGGTGDDAWMVKLGTDTTPEAFPMAGPTTPGNIPPIGPTPEGMQQIGPGYFYSPQHGTLSTPWGALVEWSPGQPLPQRPSSASHLSLVPPNATPWNWQQPSPGGWGGYPATGGSSDVEMLKAQLAEEKRAREMDELRAEQRRREDEQRRRDEERDRRQEEQNRQMRELIATLTAKPAGPSEETLRLQRELEETKRRTEEAERENRRRDEMRLAEERHRAEMQALKESIREATSNKTDPVMTLFGQILSQQTASATETARIIRETSQAATAAAERGTTQILELSRMQRENTVESSKTVMEGMRGVLDTSTQFYQQMLEVAGSSNTPWWAGAIEKGLDKVGMIGQAIAERQQAQTTYIPPPPPPRRPVPPQAARPPVQAPPGRAAMPAAVPAAPAAPGAPRASTGGRPEGTEYDAKTEEFVLPDGYRVKANDVQREGWARVLAKPRVPNGVAAATPAAAPTPAVPLTPAATPHAPAPKKGGKKGGRTRAAAPPPPAPEPEPAVEDDASDPLPPPANGQGYTLAEMRDMEPHHVREVVDPLADDVLFGALMPSIVDLRRRVAGGMPAEEAAEAVLKSRQYLSAFGGAPPPAFELLAAEQLEVLVERLLPQTTEEYQDAVVEAMEDVLEEESGGGDEAQ